MLSQLVSLSGFLFPSSIRPQMRAAPRATAIVAVLTSSDYSFTTCPEPVSDEQKQTWRRQSGRWWESDASQIKTQTNAKPPRGKSHGRAVRGPQTGEALGVSGPQQRGEEVWTSSTRYVSLLHSFFLLEHRGSVIAAHRLSCLTYVGS